MQLQNILQLQSLIQRLDAKTFSIKTAFKLIKLSSFIDQEVKNFNEALKLIIEKYGERDEEGIFIPIEGGVKIQQDKLKEAEQETITLYQTEVELPDIIFTQEEFENIEISLADLKLLYPFFK